jgi:hypothetical protein
MGLELDDLYQILISLTQETEREVGSEVIFECNSKRDEDKEERLRRHHFKVPNGKSIKVVGWGRVMPIGTRGGGPQKPCASVSILAKLVDSSDPQVRSLEFRHRGDWDSGYGEFRGRIYKVHDEVYDCVLHTLVMACRSCLSR